MNTLTRWNPFRTSQWDPFKDLEEFENRLGAVFGRMPVQNGEGKQAIAMADWSPLVDIVEDEKEFVVKAELPGLRKEEVKVTVESGVMTITGERKFETEEKTKKYHRVERAYGRFERGFSLPEKADAGKVTAEYADGVLTVHLPKSDKPAPSAVEIKVK